TASASVGSTRSLHDALPIYEGVRSGGDGIGWGGAVDHRPQGTELRVGDCAHSDGQRRSVEPRLIEKLARLVHFGGGRDPPAEVEDRKSTRLNSSHEWLSDAG